MFKSKQLRQDWNKDLPRYWYDGSPFKTHFFNSMSLTFPEGETLFVDSVKHYSQYIRDPRLKEECTEFIKQEHWHTFAHKQFNHWLVKQDLPVDVIDADLHKRFQRIRKSPPLIWFAGTISLEHITTVLAVHFLSHPELIEKMHPHFQEIWVWHATEEVEHQAVTLKIWAGLKISRKNLRLMMTTVAIQTALVLFYYTYLLLKKDKQLWKWRTVKDAVHLFFNPKNGLIKVLGHWVECWKPNFVPDPSKYQHLIANK